MFGAKAQIAAIEKGLDFELVMVPFETAYEPKHPEVARVNPKRQVPVVIHGDIEIFDSTQIFEYFEDLRSEEHTSELQSLMRISYAVFCLKKKKITIHTQN